MSAWSRIFPVLLLLGIVGGVAVFAFGTVSAIRKPDRRSASVILALCGLAIAAFGGYIVKEVWSMQAPR